MTTFQASVIETVAVRPDELFELITDIARLPEWNEHIHHVVEKPAELVDGSQWVVQMRANGARWKSRSELEDLDAAGRQFAYVSRTDDDNPSRAHWRWQLTAAGTGTEVTVGWDLQPKTFFRKHVAAPIRNRQLQNEVRASIGAAAAAVGSRPQA
jgi:polyketide cyclase/dehydrase/lipid transport protein